MKPAITTITLLVANILLLGYIFLIDRHRDDTKTRLGTASQLASFDREAVAKVLLETPEGKAEVVKRPDGSWRITAPFEDRFDPKLISELLDDAGRLRINDTVTAKEISKEGWGDDYFGFGESSINVELLDAEGNSLAAVELGGPTPFERTIYARRKGGGADGGVHYVWGYLRDTVNRPFSDLRDRRLIYSKADDVKRVKFRPPSPDSFEVHVERGENGRWGMETPLKARCDQELVNELVAKLGKLQVAEIVDQPAADLEAAFDEGGYEIVLRQHTQEADNAKIQIEFGKLPADDQDPYVLARVSDRPGVVFRVDRRVHYEFGMSDGNSLRDRTLGDFEYDAVASVTIRRAGDPEIRLERINNAWVLRRPEGESVPFVSANGRMVKELIEKINNEEVLAFASDAAADLEPFGLEEPPLEVTITSLFVDPKEVVKEGEPRTLLEATDTLMFGVGVANEIPGAFAAYKGENFVYRIANVLPPAIARSKALDYKTLQLWPKFTPFDLRKITLKERGDADPLELEYDHERNLWTATMAGVDVTDNIDRLVLDGYMEYIGRPPRGEDWTPPSQLSDLRLADPDLSIKIDVIDPRDQTTPQTIGFAAAATREGAKIFYGRVDGQGSDVIVLDATTIRALSMPLRRLTR
ncbi:MAG: DUF4340 domain-containing protein [Verrucomicrobiales bacterium]